MNFLFLQNDAIAILMQAICRTLLHSLWIGSIAGIVAGLMLVITSKSSSTVRYNILTALLALFVLSVVVVFYQQLNMIVNRNNLLGISAAAGYFMNEGSSLQHNITTSVSTVVAWCNTHATWIVIVWLLVFFIKCTGMVADLFAIHRLRVHKVQDVPDQWKNVMIALSGKIGLNIRPLLRESLLVSQPVVIGFLKPVILFPAGLLMQLPVDEAEAILLHELAHIRRKDYLVNLVQNMVEAMFFFHPAILWLSWRISKEREHCCDDIAIEATGNKTVFVRALVNVNEIYIPKYALGFGGSRTGLLQRVQRIVNGKHIRFSFAERLLFAVCIVAGILLLSFSFPKEKIQVIVLHNPGQEIYARQELKYVQNEAENNSRKDTVPVNTRAKPKPAGNRTAPDSSLRQVTIIDTFPPGTSKDFIAGFRAAMKYREEQQSPEAISNEALRKKEIELRVRKRLGIQ